MKTNQLANVAGAFVVAVAMASWTHGARAIPTSPGSDEPVDTEPEVPAEPVAETPEVPAAAPDIIQDVIGGTPASPGTFRFNARLEDSNSVPFCSGTQIQPGWVVTAAHCIQPMNSSMTRQPARVTARIGATDINGGGFGQAGTIRNVSNIFVHPSYERSQHDDIALLQLTPPGPNQDSGDILSMGVPANSAYRRSQLRSGPVYYPGPGGGRWDGCPVRKLADGMILGWGMTSASGGSSDRLMTGMMAIWNDCAAPTGWFWETWDWDMDDKIIASGEASSCPGDSGGALIAFADDGRPFLVGVTSFSKKGCKEGEKYAAFSDVIEGRLRDWINHTIYVTEHPNQAPPPGGGVDSPVGGPPNSPGDGRPPVQEQ
ncbi:S1 family peptidase [Methyloterricola oryzae]|uniref:S1 family peptidase n=1 Tax=Methyloterricola oryzae TaxID=1495050 RepID=UPI0005EAC949|nr:serine protease [Methyloterricola oryzae]